MQEFIGALFKNYDGHIPPSMHTGQVTKVKVGLYIHGISSINERDMDYSVNMFLRQIWQDERLSYSHLVLKSYNESISLNSMKKQLWVPDLYFINEKIGNFHMVTTPNLLLRLKKNGEILFSQKLTVTLSCPMNLKKFPMDEQKCSIKLESYGYFTNEIRFEWITPDEKAVEFDGDLQLPEFEIPPKVLGNCTIYYFTGSYSCLNVELTLTRKFGYYLTQTYIPSMLIVILSWVSFWIDVRSVPARISLGLLTVLSMTTQSSGTRGQLPRVSYVKAIDLWMSTCLIFVFGALIEYAVANVLARIPEIPIPPESEEKKIYKHIHLGRSVNGALKISQFQQDVPLCLCTQLSCNQDQGIPGGLRDKDGIPSRLEHDKLIPESPSNNNAFVDTFSPLPKTYARAEFMDKISRVLFPLVFVLFNLVYWVTYLCIL